MAENTTDSIDIGGQKTAPVEQGGTSSDNTNGGYLNKEFVKLTLNPPDRAKKKDHAPVQQGGNSSDNTDGGCLSKEFIKLTLNPPDRAEKKDQPKNATHDQPTVYDKGAYDKTHKAKKDQLVDPKTGRNTLGNDFEPNQGNADNVGKDEVEEAEAVQGDADKPGVDGQDKDKQKKKRSAPHGDDVTSGTSIPSKKRRTIKPPRTPTTILAQFKTAHYALYNPALNNTAPKVSGKFIKFSAYDSYTLFVDDSVTLETFKAKVPTPGVRLDDRTAALALLLHNPKTLHKNWPAEFDVAGMIRATRMPLGSAFKKLRKVGEEDLDGKVVEEQAYYYQWWGGLHCLMGQEGFDQGLYMIRPSFEKFRCDTFGFKVTHKAVVQVSSGRFITEPS